LNFIVQKYAAFEGHETRFLLNTFYKFRFFQVASKEGYARLSFIHYTNNTNSIFFSSVIHSPKKRPVYGTVLKGSNTFLQSVPFVVSFNSFVN